jgi:hypothetical protein
LKKLVKGHLGKELIDGHIGDWAALAKQLTEKYGPAYEPKQREQLRAELLPLLIREIPEVSKDALVGALD